MRILRGLVSVLFFAVFAFGATLISYTILPFVRRRETALRIVRGIWRMLVGAFEGSGLIRVDDSGLESDIRGSILVANHPSLIDVVLLTVLIPGTFSVAKRSLRRHPLLGPIVRRVFLPDDETLLDVARPLLTEGYNILIFPEGTRSPGTREMHPWHRGAAQLALRAGAPIRPLAMRFGYRILGKGQPITDMGPRQVAIVVASLPPLMPPERMPEIFRPEALRRTRQAEETVRAALERG